MFLAVNSELREDSEFMLWIDEMELHSFSILNKRRYRKRFRGDAFLKQSRLLEKFPTITWSFFRQLAMDLTHLLSASQLRESSKLLKAFDEESFRYLQHFFRFSLQIIGEI